MNKNMRAASAEASQHLKLPIIGRSLNEICKYDMLDHFGGQYLYDRSFYHFIIILSFYHLNFYTTNMSNIYSKPFQHVVKQYTIPKFIMIIHYLVSVLCYCLSNKFLTETLFPKDINGIYL